MHVRNVYFQLGTPPPSVYLSRQWRHPRDKYTRPSPLFCILQVHGQKLDSGKAWEWGYPSYQICYTGELPWEKTYIYKWIYGFISLAFALDWCYSSCATSLFSIPKADQHTPNATTYLLDVTPSNLLLCPIPGECRMNISKLQRRLASFPALPVFIVIEVKCTNGSGLGMRLWYSRHT